MGQVPMRPVHGIHLGDSILFVFVIGVRLGHPKGKDSLEYVFFLGCILHTQLTLQITIENVFQVSFDLINKHTHFE